MRIFLLSFLLLFIAVNLFSQQNLSGSRRNSFYTYIYHISAGETIKLFKSDMDKAGEKYLHSLVDSFTTNDDEPTSLKSGNYLFIYARDNHLHYDLKTFGDVQYKLVNNNRDLVVVLHTKQGELISDAAVFINRRRLAFDAATKTYRIGKRKKAGLLKVYYKDAVHLFSLSKSNSSYYGRNDFWRTLSNSFPLKYITAPLRRLLHPPTHYYNYFNNSIAYEKKFTGFMVFSKPRYKPGDTVKLKAFVANKNGKPTDRPLLLRLTGNDFDTDTILAIIKPYRPGGYEYDFVITDSLDLTLDDRYLVTLEELGSRKYSMDEYDGDLDEDEYASKRKVLMRGKFMYEEYELGTVRFTARADKDMNHRGNPVSVYLKATDENEMAVMDGRVQLLVTHNTSGSDSFYAAKVFIPDTLWSHSQPLEAMGETKIIIPDNVFPAASFEYQVHCNFFNANNEYKTVTLPLSFKNNRHTIYFTAVKDSLKIEQQEGAISENASANLYAFNDNDDTLQQQHIQLPATIPVNPFVKYYEIATANANADYKLKQFRGMVSCLAARTKDSVNIQALNPHRLYFWYSIFAGNKVIHRGYSDSLSYIEKVQTAKNYFVSLQYVYGNTVYNEDYTIPYQAKLLNIQVNQPEFVYPGQHAVIDIAVTNKAGKPVSNADITAWSFTDKFENEKAPFVPYLGKIYPIRKRSRNFYAERPADKSGTSQLNWERWSREMGLDSIEYFKFLHPANFYINKEAVADSITQLSPFVVLNGDLQPVHQIYIDEIPYYFSQAQHLQRYSFKVSPGKHALRLRTHNQLIKLDSVWAFKGVKTFISINADTVFNKHITATKMPDSLSNYEKALWSKYMILVENNFSEAPATITQSNLLYLLNPQENKNANNTGNILTGPFPSLYSTLTVKNQFSQPFETEGNYVFNISKGLIKQKQLPVGKYSFSQFLSSAKPAYNFHDLVLTEKEVDSLWQDYLDHRSANEELFRNERLNKFNNGQLRLGIDENLQGKPIFVKNIFLFRNDDADFVRVYNGMATNTGYVQPGVYKVFLLLKGDDYFIKDSIEIKKDGINYYQVDNIVPLRKDSLSTRIADIVNSREKKRPYAFQDDDLGVIRESFNDKYLDSSGFARYILGTVQDIKSGSPVSGATVFVKGTKFGTVTDQQGLFKLKVPQRGTIVISLVGYETVEKRINDEPGYLVKLSQRTSALNEIVVVGYGTAMKKSLTGSIASFSGDNMLMGKVAGLQISIRGSATVSENNSPLLIVDGLPFTGKLDSTDIASINIMPATTATALYGARAANGVVIITTKKASGNRDQMTGEMPVLPGNELRRNFRDAAYWQPKLQTDINGKASFNVKFPDDITKWRTFVIAMADKKQTGFAEGTIKSFKAISAALSLPAFAIEGDSINAIGKVQNYTLDSMEVKRSFSINDTVMKQGMVGLRNSIIDTLAVAVAANDSLKLKYTIERADNYFDGEERTIPVFKQGVQETKGYFAALDKDTSFTLSFEAAAGKVKLYAESSLLPVVLDEIESIRRYEYLCNEQLASKLKALLLKKNIYGYLKKEFKEERNIEGLITKLSQSKSQAGLWAWWNNNNDPVLWISLQATEALLLAEKAGYKISINKDMIKDYLVYNFEKYNAADMLSSALLLKLLNIKADFKKYTDTLEKRTSFMNLYQHLQLLRLKQQLGMQVFFDTLLTKYKTTMFGNIYWGEDNNRFFDNAAQNTVLMYQLMKTAGGYDRQLQKIRSYFLEKRRDGKWRNTYESSLILETILPDIIKNEVLPAQPVLTINNSVQVQSYPYSAEVSSAEKLTIKKQGDWPVYFTAYQQYWNAAPEKVSGNFAVTSSFEKNEQPITALKAGEPVMMKVLVDVKADAEYVMIEIPVPAGCSYKDKGQQYLNNEVHREYFKNKVSIFCGTLRKGQYRFFVSLLPRFTGNYHLNPAKAEMMYFPVFYGREVLRKVRID